MSADPGIDVAGLRIDPITKKALLRELSQRIGARQKTFVVTAYSEFLYASMRSGEVARLVNSADFVVADGIGILWADLFLRQPLESRQFWLRCVEAWWQVVWTGASILLKPSLLYQTIPEKIVGASLVWDLAELAQERDFKVYLLGGFGGTPKKVAQRLQAKFPGLQIVGASHKDWDDESAAVDIAQAKPDMLLVSYGRIKQEQWIARHLPHLPVSFAIGLGGSFDYLAGAKLAPPKFVRALGLEWLYRLLTQPHRVTRIYRAVVGLILALVRYKLRRSRN
jgi:N-acetylglucosaminyldiphosphoundecaprenol N-acetyl-beta-D-mannosaminyltransferase